MSKPQPSQESLTRRPKNRLTRRGEIVGAIVATAVGVVAVELALHGMADYSEKHQDPVITQLEHPEKGVLAKYEDNKLKDQGSLMIVTPDRSMTAWEFAGQINSNHDPRIESDILSAQAKDPQHPGAAQNVQPGVQYVVPRPGTHGQ